MAIVLVGDPHYKIWSVQTDSTSPGKHLIQVRISMIKQPTEIIYYSNTFEVFMYAIDKEARFVYPLFESFGFWKCHHNSPFTIFNNNQCFVATVTVYICVYIIIYKFACALLNTYIFYTKYTMGLIFSRCIKQGPWLLAYPWRKAKTKNLICTACKIFKHKMWYWCWSFVTGDGCWTYTI